MNTHQVVEHASQVSLATLRDLRLPIDLELASLALALAQRAFLVTDRSLSSGADVARLYLARAIDDLKRKHGEL